MSVKQVSKITGISVRTLHYYDEIGLLKPTVISESGYRLYDDNALDKLQQILLFRELEFPLKEIKKIMNSSGYNRVQALEQQINLLTLKKEHLENVIMFARSIKFLGVRAVDFTVFDTSKMDEYAKRAKENFGQTDAYKEFEKKQKERSPQDEQQIVQEMMSIFSDFGNLKNLSADSLEVQNKVKELKKFITENFYQCTDKILLTLSKWYASDGEFTENIDNAGGKGTANFVAAAIEFYVKGIKTADLAE